MADNVKSLLAGDWVEDSTQNLTAYMNEMGVSEENIKALEAYKNKTTIKVDGDVINIISDYGRGTADIKFKLGESIEYNYGVPNTGTASWENESLVVKMARKDGTKQQTIERRREKDNMIQTMLMNGVVCVRTYKRA